MWCGTQNGEAALAAASEACGLPVAKCEVYKMLLGGGFGRRGRADYVRQAVLIAKEMPGTPVKLIWSREEDMTHCQYHPTTMCKLTGGLDAQGNLVGLHIRISGQSILASLLPQNLQNGMDPVVFQGLDGERASEAAYGYNVPNLLIDHAMRNPHITAGFWRGVNTNQNAVYMECFMDELADAAGQDPLAFRMKLLKPKWAAVLKAAADKAGYGKPLPAGHFHGIAQVMGYGSYVAGVAEVSVSADGVLKIHKITAATNCGHVVNPAQIERQVAGSFVYGLSAALYGEITVKDGAVEQTNFDSYNVMRIDEMPKVETVLVPTARLLGRRRRADHRRGRARGAERHRPGHRQARAQPAADASRAEERLHEASSAAPGAGQRIVAGQLLGRRAGRAADAGPPGASSCTGCHAAKRIPDSVIPRIAGRKAADIVQFMREYRSGAWPSTVMGRIAKGFNDQQIDAIAAWFAAQPE